MIQKKVCDALFFFFLQWILFKIRCVLNQYLQCHNHNSLGVPFLFPDLFVISSYLSYKTIFAPKMSFTKFRWDYLLFQFESLLWSFECLRMSGAILVYWVKFISHFFILWYSQEVWVYAVVLNKKDKNALNTVTLVWACIGVVSGSLTVLRCISIHVRNSGVPHTSALS